MRVTWKLFLAATLGVSLASPLRAADPEKVLIRAAKPYDQLISKIQAAGGTVTFAGWKNNGGGYQVWIAHGSGAELETQLELGARVKVVSDKEATALISDAQEIGRMLKGLVASLERSVAGAR